MIRQALRLIVVFAVLQLAWQGLEAAHLTRSLVEVLVVRPAAWEVNVLTPAVQASAQGIQLHAAGGSLNVINGCDGTDLLFLLVAGFYIAPVTGRRRVTGMLLGVAVVHVLNQARLLALFYAARSSPDWFDALHGMLAPLGVILLLGAYYYAWLRTTPMRMQRSA